MKTCKSGRHSFEGRNCKKCQYEKVKEWAKKNPTKVRAQHLKLKFWPHLTGAEALAKYEEMVKAQGNTCAICKKGDLTKGLSVDHCHESKKIRGLLCDKCNLAIGLLQDSPEICYSAGDYLKAGQSE
jgi:hypothetical protein